MERETRLELATPALASTDHALPTWYCYECLDRLDWWTSRREIGAGNETRTRDPDLGKVVLYQLSYSRNRMSFASDWSGKRDSNSRPRPWQGRALPTELFPQRNITYIYLLKLFGAGNETRTRDPDLGKVVLYQLSYSRNRLSFANDWSGKRDSNSRPRPWQGRALPTELFPQRNVICK